MGQWGKTYVGVLNLTRIWPSLLKDFDNRARTFWVPYSEGKPSVVYDICNFKSNFGT